MDNSNLIIENNINKSEDDYKKIEKNEELVSEKKDAFLDKNIQGNVNENEIVGQPVIDMPQVISGAQAGALAQNAPQVMARTETERNMPQSHVAIVEAKSRIDAYNRGYDSAEMQAVKEKTDELNKLIKYNTISPSTDDEFSSSLSEVKAGYDELIACCKLYVKKAGFPITTKGRRRRDVVKNILLQATTERKMMEDSAIAMRKKAANDQKTVFTFEDLIPAITVPSEDQIPVQKLEISPDSLKAVRLTRLAVKLGAQSYVPDADIKTYRTAQGLKDYVTVTGQQEDNNNNIIVNDKKSNTARIIWALVEGRNAQQMAEIIADIKNSEEKADRDVLNNLLTTSAEDLLLSLGSALDEKSAKAFIKAVSTFKKELKKSDLGSILELYVMNTETDIAVSDFTIEEIEKQKIIKDIPEEEKDGLLKEGTEENTIDYTSEEPQHSPKRLERYKDRTFGWTDRRDATLFEHEPSINDIEQGHMGDCYFLAAIGNIVSTKPEIIKEMMRDNKDGTVTVRFFDFDHKREEGQLLPIYVKVNKTVAQLDGQEDLNAKNCLWVQLLEKAFVCSGIAKSMQNLFDKVFKKEHMHLNLSLDLRNPNIYDFAPNMKAFGPTTKELKENEMIEEKKTYGDLEGGFASLVLPLMTGKYMKDTRLQRDGLYWHDFKNADKLDKVQPDTETDFYSFGEHEDEDAKEYLYSIMKRHDEKKKKEIDKENEEIKEYNEGVYEKRKKYTKEERQNMSYGQMASLGLVTKDEIKFAARKSYSFTSEEKDMMKYYMYTGKKIPEDKEDPETLSRIKTCSEFVKEFLSYLDKNEKITLNMDPSKLYMRHLNGFNREFISKAKDEEKKALREAFLNSDDYISVCNWFKKRLKRPDGKSGARYTHFTGKYYGKALDIYENIDKALKDKKLITAATDEDKLKETRGKITEIKEDEDDGIVGGLVVNHAYSVVGVTERKFGGKTFKFVVLRNPWKSDGTQYFYNPKTKKLLRRSVKDDNSTGGYTMIELSEFMMISDHVFFQDKVGLKGEAQ